jgi:hypothetical protein
MVRPLSLYPHPSLIKGRELMSRWLGLMMESLYPMRRTSLQDLGLEE